MGMKIFLMTLALAAMATSAIAGDRERRGGSQIQGQHQGQLQAQHQGQRQSTYVGGQRNKQSVNVEGDDFETPSIAPGIGADGCAYSVSGGIPGASAGLSVPSGHCNKMKELDATERLFGKPAAQAYATQNFPRINQAVTKANAPAILTTSGPRVVRALDTMTAAQRRSEER